MATTIYRGGFRRNTQLLMAGGIRSVSHDVTHHSQAGMLAIDRGVNLMSDKRYISADCIVRFLSAY